jgi:peptide/nickel transport system permease protein
MRHLLSLLAKALATLWAVVTLLFVLFNLLGDPAQMVAGQRTDKATLAALTKDLGLDKPLHVRYALYLQDLSPVAIYPTPRLKKPWLRTSLQHRKPVSALLKEKFPGTLLLALSAVALALLVGLPLDAAFLAGFSLPGYFLAVLLVWLFIDVIGWRGMPVTGHFWTLDPHAPQHTLWQPLTLLMPTLCLALRPMAILYRLTTSAVEATLRAEFIRTARSKGLSQAVVLLKHAFPLALPPVLTAFSGWFATLLGGAFFVEYLFDWQGIGKLAVDALLKADFPVVMGVCLLTATVFIAANEAVALLLKKIDPRLR